MVASSSRVLSFGILRCSSRTTFRASDMCFAYHAQLGSRVALFFKIIWPKLLRSIAYLYCFLNRFRCSKNSQANIAIYLLSEEIQIAKRYWLKTIQAIMFPNEIAALTHKRLVPKNSPLFVLNPYMDEDGFVRGRLRRGCLPGATRNLIVLHAHPRLFSTISTHYLAPSFSNVACRFSINARVIATQILDSSGPCHHSIRSL